MPSVTIAATPLFLAMAVTLSPTTAVAEKPSAAATITSPGSASTSAARMARLSLAPVSQVSAGTDELRPPAVDRLHAMVERTAPVQRIDDVAALRASSRAISSRGSRWNLRRMVRRG